MQFYRRFVTIYGFVLIAIIGNLFLVISPLANAQMANPDGYPKLANIYLKSPISMSDADSLARWDVVIFHLLAQQNSAAAIRHMREKNPHIIILVYITDQEFATSEYQNWEANPNGLLHKLRAGITDDMWLLDGSGHHVTFWKDFWMLNVTNYQTAGQRWNDYLSSFVVNDLLSSGLWDGVFYDNAWNSVSWVNGGKIDSDRNMVDDNKDALDRSWDQGMTSLIQMTRAKAKRPIIIVGNGDRGFYGDINGLYMENFVTANYLSWAERMRLYSLSAATSQAPRIAIVGNTAVPGRGQKDYRTMRFGLASALLADGSYAFDDGSSSHAEQWWYDEYDTRLGIPTGAAQSKTNSTKFADDVWRRDYTNGLALVNATTISQDIDLGGEYEKIIGHQQPTVNDGSIADHVTLGARDGILMLKTFKTLKGVVFKNGTFARFYKDNGTRARNGFFIFEAGYPGGAKIYNGDLNGDGTEEKIVATGAKLQIYNSSGQLWYNDYPFGGNYKGELNIAVGKALGTPESQIIVAPSKGGKVVVYNYHGTVLKDNWYPLGTKYKNGFSVAVGPVDGGLESEVIFGVGTNQPAEVLVFDLGHTKLKRRFYPFTKKYKGSANIAVGDYQGTGKITIAAVSTSGTKPIVRLFNGVGKQLSEFTIGGFFGSQIITLGSDDVNFEGKDEIVAMSAN